MTTHRSLARPAGRSRAEGRPEIRWKDRPAKSRTRRFAPAGAGPGRHAASDHEVASLIAGETLAALVLLLAFLMALRAIATL
jgi:hypothetical protein